MREEVAKMVESLTPEEARELIEALYEPAFAESVECPRCGGRWVMRKGRDRDGTQRWLCYECNRTFNGHTVMRLARKQRPLVDGTRGTSAATDE